MRYGKLPLLLLLAPCCCGSSNEAPSPAVQLEAVAQQLPAIVAWALEAERRLARCEGRDEAPPSRPLGGAASLGPAAAVAAALLPDYDEFDPEEAALWVWRAIAGVVVIAATCVVAPRDKHYRQHVQAMVAAEIGASSSVGASSTSTSSDRLDGPPADSSLAHSLGEWAASQEQAWVQPTEPAGVRAAEEESELPAGLPEGMAAAPAASPTSGAVGEDGEDDPAVESLQSQLVRSNARSVRSCDFVVLRLARSDRSCAAVTPQVDAEAEVVRLRVLLEVAQSY